MDTEFDVLVYFSRRDASALADQIIRELEMNGLRVYRDETIVPGNAALARIGGIVGHARALVVLLSRAAADSEGMDQSAAYALRRHSIVITVILDRSALDSPLGSLLADRPSIDASCMDTRAVIKRLVMELEKFGFSPPRVFTDAGVATSTEENIRPAEPEFSSWDVTNPNRSLKSLRDNVEAEAHKAIDWYWKQQRWKKIPSQWIQFLAVSATAAAAITPIVIQIVKSRGRLYAFDSGPIASLLICIAAALLGIDKAFGFSSGWTRYVLTATAMTKLLHQFRLDWVGLTAAANTRPTPQQQAALIQRAKEFSSAIEGLVMQESKDWATEFQGNMTQLEKNELEGLKAQLDRVIQDEELRHRPGAIELIVTNADKTDGFHFEVVLEGQSGRFADSISNSNVHAWSKMTPGTYTLSVVAKAKGTPISTATVIDVGPGETAKPSVVLPLF